METESVFDEYEVINDDWELHKNPDQVGIKELWGTSLGTKIQAHCLDVGKVSNEVMSEITKFNNIYAYYVRHLMVGNAFISYPSNGYMTSKARDDIFKSYNIDAWNRQFPYFIDNVASDYYKSLDGISGMGGIRMRYGYWVFYRDRVISCSASNNHIINADRLLSNVPPLMVLTTTSLDGITVACLDIVGK